MRIVDPNAQALREARAGISERKLIHIAARNRTSGVVEELAMWTGTGLQSVLVPFSTFSKPVVFTGGGSLIDVGEVVNEVGLNIRPTKISLATYHPEVVNAIRVYDVQGASVNCWTLTIDLHTGKQVGVERWFTGQVNTAPLFNEMAGGETQVTINVVSRMRLGTVKSHLRKSDEHARRRSNDRIRKYKASPRDVPWGTK